MLRMRVLLVCALLAFGVVAACAAEVPSDFNLAGGIEDRFIPQTKPGLRALKEYELTQHPQQWREDPDRGRCIASPSTL